MVPHPFIKSFLLRSFTWLRPSLWPGRSDSYGTSPFRVACRWFSRGWAHPAISALARCARCRTSTGHSPSHPEHGRLSCPPGCPALPEPHRRGLSSPRQHCPACWHWRARPTRFSFSLERDRASFHLFVFNLYFFLCKRPKHSLYSFLFFLSFADGVGWSLICTSSSPMK